MCKENGSLVNEPHLLMTSQLAQHPLHHHSSQHSAGKFSHCTEIAFQGKPEAGARFLALQMSNEGFMGHQSNLSLKNFPMQELVPPQAKLFSLFFQQKRRSVSGKRNSFRCAELHRGGGYISIYASVQIFLQLHGFFLAYEATHTGDTKHRTVGKYREPTSGVGALR